MLLLRAALIAAASAATPCPSAADRIAPVDARYVLRHERGAAPRLRVELHVRGDDDGESRFSVLEGWGGIAKIAPLLHELSFRDEAGAALAAKADGERAWLVTHAPGAPLVASWWLGEPQPAANGAGNDYRPRVSDELFFLLGNTGLLRADALAGDEKRRFAVDFEGCAGACSFGAGPHVEVEETQDAFCHATFLGGAIRLLWREATGGKLLFALSGKPAFRDEALADLAARIVALERGFFADRGDPLFAITLVVDPAAQGSSLGGTGLTRSFALFVSPNMKLEAGGEDAMRIAGLLAHEHFHHWNGGIVGGEKPEGTSYWFSEGFTDFFTRRLLVRAGIWTPAQWASQWNETIAAFDRSPARTAPAARIVKEFWSDRDVSQLPYQRGALVAALLDLELRAASDGGLSLDDFMREVVARAVQRKEPADTERLLALASDWTSPEVAQRLRAIVVEGALPELPEDLFGPGTRLRAGPPRRVEIERDADPDELRRRL